MRPQIVSRRSKLAPIAQSGLVLPVALVAAGILFAGCMGLAIAGAASREGSAKQYQAKQALEVAEAGLTATLEKLNGVYRYLLIRNLEDWSSTTLNPTQICPNAATSFSSMPKSGTITDNAGETFGTYTVTQYAFSGNSYYGGTGTIKVQGNISQAGRTIASSIITATIQVVPKNCGGTITTPPTTSGFPGLIGTTVSLGGNDVLGTVNGNILCMSCTGATQSQLATQMNKGTNSVVNGTLFGGTIPLPPIPEPPSTLVTTGEAISSSKTYTSNTNNGGFCVVSDGVTSCRIASVNLSGSNTLTFNTTATPIRVYLDGNVSFSGTARIIHSGPSARLSFFGRLPDSDSDHDQTFVISGGSTSTNAFIYMPDGCVGINGGSNTPDFLGAIWAYRYGGACGSSSNNGDVRVPDDMGGTLTDVFGDTYNVSIRDFAAAGIKAWSASTGN